MSNGVRRAFDHVLVIMFENQYRSYVLQNPYMRRLARQGIQLANYFGVMHPSQTNYIASAAGCLCNVTSDGVPPLSSERTIVDLIEEAPGRVRWKAYMDSYVPESTPWTPDFAPKDAPPYYIKHNPFASFASVVRNQARWSRIQSDAALFADLLNGELPEYAWFTPNIWNDGHYLNGTHEESKPRAPGLVDQAARWLESFFNRLRFPGPKSHLPPRTLVVVTFDEADFEDDYLPEQASAYDGPNQIYTVLLGDGIEPGFEEEGYNHYSLLRTIEQNFSLGDLDRNDAGANWFQFLWDRRFSWGKSASTPVAGAGPIAAAGFAGALFVATSSKEGVRVRTLADGHWSDQEALIVDGSGGLAMASTFGTLVLVARDAHGQASALTYSLEHGWSPPSALGAADAVAAASFDKERRIMVAMRCGNNVTTRIFCKGAFAEPVAVPAAESDGALSLGSLGAALYLIVKAPGQNTMNVVSYNTAEYNVVMVPTNKYGGAQDNTTIEQWSPCSFPVEHFSSWPLGAPNARQPRSRPYEVSGPIAVATLDGVLHLVHAGAGNPLLQTETFSIAGVMTPSQPISYKSSDSATAGNGFGTLAEAGWSLQAPLFGRNVGPTGALAAARVGETIYLLYRTEASSSLQIAAGRYETSR